MMNFSLLCLAVVLLPNNALGSKYELRRRDTLGKVKQGTFVNRKTTRTQRNVRRVEEATYCGKAGYGKAAQATAGKSARRRACGDTSHEQTYPPMGNDIDLVPLPAEPVVVDDDFPEPMVWTGPDDTDQPGGANNPASIIGRIFQDVDGSGVDDAEPGVGGISVTLLDEKGDVVATTLTRDDGSYIFEDLSAGDYTVSFPTEVNGNPLVAPNQGDDDTIDSDADPTTGLSPIISVGAGESIGNISAGTAGATARIAGRVFQDVDGSGVDETEPGVVGVAVSLLDQNGDVVGTTMTGNDGSYSFEGLSAGDYTVSFPSEVNGNPLVAPNQGGDDTIDSDADPTTGLSPVISVGAGENAGHVNAGTGGPTASITGRIFQDIDGSAVDEAEPGVVDVLVTLLDENGDVVATAFSDADGSYSFEGLIPGDYIVSFPTQMNGNPLVAPDQGGDDTVDSDADPTTGLSPVISVGAGEDVGNVNAGTAGPTAAIAGRVFQDNDGSGVDETEPGVAGVPVTLLDENGDVVATTLSDADGLYSFEGLMAGGYTVSFPTEVNGMSLVAPNQGGDDANDSDADPSTGMTPVLSVGAGENVGNVNAGTVVPAATIAGKVFEDIDGSGVDDTEPGVVGVPVTLLNENGDVVATTFSDADGSYSFEGLIAGDYTVSFPPEVNGNPLVAPGQGADDTVDSDADPATGLTPVIRLGAGQDVGNVNAGTAVPAATIAGRLFEDIDGSGVDETDPGVEGVTVTLLDENGDVVASTSSDSDGNYSFAGLIAGDYTVSFPTEVNGNSLVAPNQGADDTVDSDADTSTGLTPVISVGAGESVGNVNAGFLTDPICDGAGCPNFSDDDFSISNEGVEPVRPAFGDDDADLSNDLRPSFGDDDADLSNDFD